MVVEIYDKENVLVESIIGTENLKIVCREKGYPYKQTLRSYREGIKFYEDSRPGVKKYNKFIGWYAKVVENELVEPKLN